MKEKQWTMEHVAALFCNGGFQAIADAHNRTRANNIPEPHDDETDQPVLPT